MYYLKQASPENWATVVHFLTQDVSHISLDQWNSMSEGQVCMKLEDWADINKMVSSFCSAPGIDCNYQISPGLSLREALNGFFLRLAFESGLHFETIE